MGNLVVRATASQAVPPLNDPNFVAGNFGKGILAIQASGTQAYADGEWHHLAGRVSDGELQCFFDGLPLGAAVAVDTGTQSLSTGALFAALFASVTDRFAGDIALAAVYSDALSDGEIAQNYLRGPA